MAERGLDSVSVVGAGAWGTALAQAAARAGRAVSLCGRDSQVVAEINSRHTSTRHLGDAPLDPAIVARIGFTPADIVIMAVPAQQTRAALAEIGGAALDGVPVVLSAKGLEQETLRRQSEILHEIAPGAVGYVLSGPSFAADVARGRPTAVTLAGDIAERTSELAAALAGPSFRPYAADDRIGVEIAGGLKNVYALACGAVEGAGLGASARAALIARAYAEMARFVVKLGGSASTLTGLAGLGDLTLSCTSTQSRNYAFGVGLGQGGSVAAIRAGGAPLAEGVMTTPAAAALAHRLGVEVPLIDAVAALLGGKAAIAEIVAGLMSRPLKRET